VQLAYLVTLMGFLVVGAYLVVRQVLIRRELEEAAKVLGERVRTGEASGEVGAGCSDEFAACVGWVAVGCARKRAASLGWPNSPQLVAALVDSPRLDTHSTCSTRAHTRCCMSNPQPSIRSSHLSHRLFPRAGLL
jgi:hypothetical protein